MAKLLGARVAWAAADNALQIHGGNGFALEYQISRILCDARILNILGGAAQTQAQVLARRPAGRGAKPGGLKRWVSIPSQRSTGITVPVDRDP